MFSSGMELHHAIVGVCGYTCEGAMGYFDYVVTSHSNVIDAD